MTSTTPETTTEAARMDQGPSAGPHDGMRRSVGWLFAFGGIVACVVLAASAPRDIVAAFKTVRFGPAMLAVILMVVTRVVDAWLLIHLFSDDSARLNFRQTIRIVTLQNLSAFVAPKSGLVAAAAILKIEHGVGLARFTGVQIASLAIKVVMTASIGVAASIGVRFGDSSNVLPASLDVLIAGLAALPLLVGIGYLIASRADLSRRKGGRIRTAFCDAWLGIANLSHDRRRLAWILVLSAVTAATKILSFLLVVYGVLGAIDSPLGVVVVSSVSELGTALSLTPAGLGVREAAAGLTAVFAGLTPPLMIGIALVDRALMLLATGIMTPAIFIRVKASTRRPSLD